MTRDVFGSRPFRVPITFIPDDEEGYSTMRGRRPRQQPDPFHRRHEETPDHEPERNFVESERPRPEAKVPVGGEPDFETNVETGEGRFEEVSPSETAESRETARDKWVDAGADDLRRQLEESITREKRWLADLDNYRRRTERLFEEQAEMRKRALATDLLDVADDLDRALDHSEDTEGGLGRGVEAIRDKLFATLGRHGITPFNPANEPFDPSTMEAVSVIRHPELANNTVAQVLRTGWKAGDKLLRPAHVVVVKNE